MGGEAVTLAELPQYVPAASLGEVFREVGRGAEYGVVPVEEASEGLVTHALDYFLDSDLLIVGEIFVEAAHALLTHTGQVAGVGGGVLVGRPAVPAALAAAARWPHGRAFKGAQAPPPATRSSVR